MSSADDLKVWPSLSAPSTFNFYPRTRENEGVGTWQTAQHGLADLAIVFPSGREAHATHTAIKEACVRHLLNNANFMSWWSPPIGTPEQCLRDALAQYVIHSGTTGTAAALFVFFDGQFSAVTCG